MPSRRTDNVAAVERAFAIVQVVATATESLGVSELARRCELPKTTIVRLLRTLEDLEVLERAAKGGGYRVGSALSRLALGFPAPGQVRDVARPLLRRLVDELEEDVGLAVTDGTRMLFIDQISCEKPVQVPDWSGQRMPYHAAAAGFVLLAGMDAAEAEHRLAGELEPWTPWTVTDEEQVRRRVAQARARGITWVHEEWARGINGIAAPIYDRDDRLIAAINVYGPSYRFPGSRSEADIEGRVLATAESITAALAPARPHSERD